MKCGIFVGWQQDFDEKYLPHIRYVCLVFSRQYIENHFADKHVSFVDTRGLGCNDLIFDDASAADAVARFREAEVDAVLLINTNFGNEEAAADIAKAVCWLAGDDSAYVTGQIISVNGGMII